MSSTFLLLFRRADSTVSSGSALTSFTKTAHNFGSVTLV